jgi:hypothetical protein
MAFGLSASGGMGERTKEDRLTHPVPASKARHGSREPAVVSQLMLATPSWKGRPGSLWEPAYSN